MLYYSGVKLEITPTIYKDFIDFLFLFIYIFFLNKIIW